MQKQTLGQYVADKVPGSTLRETGPCPDYDCYVKHQLPVETGYLRKWCREYFLHEHKKTVDFDAAFTCSYVDGTTIVNIAVSNDNPHEIHGTIQFL